MVIASDLAAARARLFAAVESDYRLPTLVVVDVRLPDGDGLELVRWARQQPSLFAVRFVVVSNYLSGDLTRRAYEVGANSVIDKASIIDDLEAVEGIAHYWVALNEPLPPR